MRIIGEIAHPSLKITVMKNDGRLLVKFEDGLLEQTYKFRAAEELNSLAQVEKLCSPRFLEQINSHFLGMKKNHQQALGEYLQGLDNAEEFPTII